ncbi:MAG: hypothetical protein JW829_16315, partial [Pirellulales bacterium]|nr:hypothetical protein [Pirellulales bacterium]
MSANGKSTVLAKLIEWDGSNVILEREDGRRITVSINKLSSQDRDYLLSLTGNPIIGDGSERKQSATTAAEIEDEAKTMPTAKQALLIYQFHLSGAKLTDSERRAAEARRDHWKELAEKGYQRLGDQWMPGEEAEAQRKKARDKFDYAYEMLRLGNGELSEKALREASRLDPDNIQADFLMGLVYSLVVDNDKKAVRHFEECLKRDPNNVGAMNNLAICCFYEKEYTAAVRYWLQSVEISPETPALAQNIGSLISITSRSNRIRIPQRRMEELSAAYEALITQHGQSRPNAIGFVYLPPTGLSTDKKSGKQSSGRQLVVVGSGTGFVIAPD